MGENPRRYSGKTPLFAPNPAVAIGSGCSLIYQRHFTCWWIEKIPNRVLRNDCTRVWIKMKFIFKPLRRSTAWDITRVSFLPPACHKLILRFKRRERRMAWVKVAVSYASTRGARFRIHAVKICSHISLQTPVRCLPIREIRIVVIGTKF